MEDKSDDLFLFWQVGQSGTSCAIESNATGIQNTVFRYLKCREDSLKKQVGGMGNKSFGALHFVK